MSLVSLIAALFLTAAPQSAPDTPDLRNLRWVLGVVTASSSDSITVKLRDRELTITVEEATDLLGAPPAAGALAEVHYSDRRGVRRAVAVVPVTTPGEVSKKPRASLRGTVTQFKRGNLTVRTGSKIHELAVNKRSRLIDPDGQPLASGSEAIAKLLAADAEVLVKYEGDIDILVGDITLYGGGDKVIEIRQLRADRTP